MSVIKNVGPKLVPFFKTLAIYFVVFVPHNQPGYFAALLKCLPIVSLIVFVLWYGKHIEDERKAFSRRILRGLILCCMGDFCLIWPTLFELGMVFFTMGHVNYIRAFGFKPLNLPLAAFLYVIALIGCLYLTPGLNGTLLFGVPAYTFILNTMAWRACARLEFSKDSWSWTKLLTALGAISFIVSDLIIGISFFKFQIPHDQLIIMGTYYAAQFGIAMSVVDDTRQKARSD